MLFIIANERTPVIFHGLVILGSQFKSFLPAVRVQGEPDKKAWIMGLKE